MASQVLRTPAQELDIVSAGQGPGVEDLADTPRAHAATAPPRQAVSQSHEPVPSQNAQSQNAQSKSGWIEPAAIFERRMFSDGRMKMPDGATIDFWGFSDPRDPDAKRTLPSPLIRVREGECVQIKLEIEAAGGETQRSARHDTAASHARLRSTSHIYQWQPKDAGTWLYQSHASTLRQFEMGLFGLLIVDPAPAEDGRPRAYRDGPAYDVERCFVFDDVDPQWHGPPPPASPASHSGRQVSRAGAAGETFAPKYFLVNGVPNVETLDNPGVVIDAQVGDKILIRFLNASFSLLRTTIAGLRADIISVDGKALAGKDRPWSRWSAVAPGQPVYMATGARHDLLIDLDPANNRVQSGDEFAVNFEFLDLTKRAVRNADAPSPLNVGRATTRIRVQ